MSLKAVLVDIKAVLMSMETVLVDTKTVLTSMKFDQMVAADMAHQKAAQA